MKLNNPDLEKCRTGRPDWSLEDAAIILLSAVGEDLDRKGLHDTPKRVAKAWLEWTEGYKIDPKEVLRASFEDGAENYDQMVVLRDIPVYSHCEHHLAPFFGVAHIAYLPKGRVVGLSKLSRLVDVFAHRLQVQERLTAQIASALNEHVTDKGVGVVLECRHMCMESRGISKSGIITTTSALHGAIKDEDAARAEFLSLIANRASRAF